MQTIYEIKISQYTIITHVSEAVVDTRATEEEVMAVLRKQMAKKGIKGRKTDDIFLAAIKLGMTEKEMESLFDENKVYARTGEGAENVDDDKGNQVREKLKEMGKKRLLLKNMEYIPNYLGTEYHVKRLGRWHKEKIDDIGIELPEGAVLQEDITPEQQKEITEQMEMERIAAMPPEKKEEEKQNALDVLADEADRLERRNKRRRKAFDPDAYYDEGAKKIEAKYK